MIEALLRDSLSHPVRAPIGRVFAALLFTLTGCARKDGAASPAEAAPALVRVSRIERTQGTSTQPVAGTIRPFEREGIKVGRNEPCPCGSGKKYKQCHGKLS